MVQSKLRGKYCDMGSGESKTTGTETMNEMMGNAYQTKMKHRSWQEWFEDGVHSLVRRQLYYRKYGTWDDLDLDPRGKIRPVTSVTDYRHNYKVNHYDELVVSALKERKKKTDLHNERKGKVHDKDSCHANKGTWYPLNYAGSRPFCKFKDGDRVTIDLYSPGLAGAVQKQWDDTNDWFVDHKFYLYFGIGVPVFSYIVYRIV